MTYRVYMIYAISTNRIGSVCMLYMVTLTINIPQILAYIPYMDPMGIIPRYLPKSTYSARRDRNQAVTVRFHAGWSRQISGHSWRERLGELHSPSSNGRMDNHPNP